MPRSLKMPEGARRCPPMEIFTPQNPKLLKGMSAAFLPVALMMAPANRRPEGADEKKWEVCSHASPGCRKACLNLSGKGQMAPGGLAQYKDSPEKLTNNDVQRRRLERKRLWIEEPEKFWEKIFADIELLIEFAEHWKYGGKDEDKKPYFVRREPGSRKMKVVVRMNGTSDIPWEREPVGGKPNVMAHFPQVQFYDYTKMPRRFNLPKNYYLTFSQSERDESITWAKEYEARGFNTAVVFDNLDLWDTYRGMQVIDGMETDLRFIDYKLGKPPCVVGLQALGYFGKRDQSGFVVRKGKKSPQENPGEYDENNELFPDLD